jgi:hypothetical protein
MNEVLALIFFSTFLCPHFGHSRLAFSLSSSENERYKISKSYLHFRHLKSLMGMYINSLINKI